MTSFDPSSQADLLLAINDDLLRRIEHSSAQDWQQSPAPAEWSAAQILGHMVEMEPFWARAAAAVAARPGTRIGRATESEARLAGPRSGADLTPQEAVNRLMAAGEEASEILREIPASAGAVAGLRLDGTPITVAEIVERLLLNHAQDHTAQIVQALNAAAGK